MSDRPLCRMCRGNGVIRFRGGVSQCYRCGGDCWEPSDDFTDAQKWRFAQQEGELIAAECAEAGTDDAKPIFERVKEMRLRLQRAEVLVRCWLREADEINADGDYCCGQTRRNDAEQLRDALRTRIEPRLGRSRVSDGGSSGGPCAMPEGQA
jgi:hypothetical protein